MWHCGEVRKAWGRGVGWHTDVRLQKVQDKMHQEKVGLLHWKVRDVPMVAVAGEETGGLYQ